jgi:uncharacterized protein YbbC (DUF1343 family)
VYPGTCFFEGVNASEGRGTTRPFEYLGAPWVDGREWAAALNDLGLPGVGFRSCYFTPVFWRYSGERCGGVQLHVTDRDLFKPVETGLHLLRTMIDLHQGSFAFNEPTYEERRHFDLLTGTDRLRRSLADGAEVDEIVSSWTPGLTCFRDECDSILLYGEAAG